MRQATSRTNRTLTESFYPLATLSALFHPPACAVYKYFSSKKVAKEVRQFAPFESLSEQATALYNFLVHKYCFHYWLVHINDGLPGCWRHKGHSYFVGIDLVLLGDMYGGMGLHANYTSIYVAWSNSRLE